MSNLRYPARSRLLLSPDELVALGNELIEINQQIRSIGMETALDVVNEQAKDVHIREFTKWQKSRNK